MDWADDLKLTLKKSAKKGRRAAAALLQGTTSSSSNNPGASSTSTNLDTENIITSTSSLSSSTAALPDKETITEQIDSLTNFDQIESDEQLQQPQSTDIPIKKSDYLLTKTKKIGGWADDVIKLGRNKSTTNLIEQERFNNSLITKSIAASSLSDDDIPIIPDLDDIQDELLLNEMVEAPTVSVNRVATYNELNSDLLKQGSFATLEDIDLSILGKCLHSESDINEGDEPWTWDKLFIEVSAEIYADNIQNDDIQSQFVH